MSNRFMSYFGGGSGSDANRFVGQLLDLGEGNKLKVKKVIAEGKSWPPRLTERVVDVMCACIACVCVYLYM